MSNLKIENPRHIGKHYWEGECDPTNVKNKWSFRTFSVGIFEWMQKAGGKGGKKGKVKVRVKGSVAEAEKVYNLANEIARQLDAGTYAGKKIVKA